LRTYQAAWPRDGSRETLEGAGIALAAQYKEQGLNLLHEFTHYVERTGQKSVSVEAGLMDMLDRMQTGRFKVFKVAPRLVGGIPPVSPQGRQSREGKR
jgi:hypothetical protein